MMTQPVLSETMGEGVTLETLMQYERMEVVDGELQEKAMTSIEHSYIVRNLFLALYMHVSRHQLGEVFSDGMTFNLYVDKDEKIRVSQLPDLCFIRADAMPKTDHKNPFPGAPTLAIEVVSPTEGSSIIQSKVADYLKYGSEQVWVVYPKSLQLIQYIKDESDPKIYKRGDTLTDESLFPGLSLVIDNIFNV